MAGSREEVTSSKYQDGEAPFRLIFLSRIEEKKGLEPLFDSLALTDSPWTLTIAGSGECAYVESLKRKAESLKLNDRVNWIGQVDNSKKYKLMAQHDLLVLTSYNENFANVIVESLSVGTPVLISDQVGLSDYVMEMDLGWVTTLNSGAISTGISTALSDKLKRERIRETGPARIRKDFSDEVLVGRYMEMYNISSLIH